MQMVRLRLETTHLARTMQNQQQASLRGIRSLPAHLTSDANSAAADTASQQQLQLGQLASVGSEESAAADQWRPQGIQTQHDTKLAVTWARNLFGPTARRPGRGRAGKGGVAAAKGPAGAQASGAASGPEGAAAEAAALPGQGTGDRQADVQPPPAGDSSADGQPEPGRPGSTRRRGTQSLSPGRTAEAAPAASVSPRRPWRAGSLSRYMEPAPGLGLDLAGTTTHLSRQASLRPSLCVV